MSDEALQLASDQRGKLESEFGFAKGGRVVTDFCLQAVQRAVILATISAAAKVTGSAVISIVETCTFLLLFAWIVYSSTCAARWLKIKTINRPDMYRLIGIVAILVEFAFMIVLWLGVGSFSSAMAERFSGGV